MDETRTVKKFSFDSGLLGSSSGILKKITFRKLDLSPLINWQKDKGQGKQ
jgi:hypothetical protein